MDIVAALGARPPQFAARESDAPRRRSEDDGGKSREGFDEALDSAAPAAESDEPRAPDTPSERHTTAPAGGAKRELGIDQDALHNAIAAEDLTQSPGDFARPLAAPTPKIETNPAPASDTNNDAGSPAAMVADIAAPLTPVIAEDTPTATLEEATTNKAAPTAIAAASPEIKRADASPADAAASNLRERMESAAAIEDIAQRPLNTKPRAIETAAPVVAKPATAETEKPAPNAAAPANAVEPSLKDARVAEHPPASDLANRPDLAGNLKLAAASSALQSVADKPDLLTSTPQITAPGERIALAQDISSQMQTAAGTKFEIQNHSPAASTDAARQVIAAIRTGAGGDGIEVRLDPPDLGRVRIHFTMDRADSVTAVVTSDRSDTLDMMRRNSADLAKELARAGFADVQMEFKSGGGDKPRADAAIQSNGSGVGVDDDAVETTHVVYTRAHFDGRLDRLV